MKKKHTVERWTQGDGHGSPEDTDTVFQNVGNQVEQLDATILAGEMETLKTRLVRYYICERMNNRGLDITSFGKEIEKALVNAARSISSNNLKLAAQILGIKYTTLIEKIKAHQKK